MVLAKTMHNPYSRVVVHLSTSTVLRFKDVKIKKIHSRSQFKHFHFSTKFLWTSTCTVVMPLEEKSQNGWPQNSLLHLQSNLRCRWSAIPEGAFRNRKLFLGARSGLHEGWLRSLNLRSSMAACAASPFCTSIIIQKEHPPLSTFVTSCCLFSHAIFFKKGLKTSKMYFVHCKL